MLEPTLHRPYKVNERVSFDYGSGQTGTGTIVGIAWVHVVASYIVLLDEFMEHPDYSDWRAVCVMGGDLKLLDEVTA